MIPYKNFTLKKGSKGKNVKKLQYMIGAKADGIFGNNTESHLMLSKGLKEVRSVAFYDMLNNFNEPHIEVARSYIGKIEERDVDGDGSPDNRDPIIDKMTKYVFDWYNPSEKDEGYAWCAIFISYVLKEAYGYAFKDARVSRWERHLNINGEYIDNNTSVDFRKDFIYIGLWVRSDGFGHIFFVDPMKSFDFDSTSLVSTIEGNTNDDGSREGDGVYRRSRDLSTFKLYRINASKLT